MAPDCFACPTEECACCGWCGRGYCWNHGESRDASRPAPVCDLCRQERAAFKAIVPGLLAGIVLVTVLFALLF